MNATSGILIIQTLNLIVLVIGIVFTYKQIKGARKEQKENYDWNKRIEAQKAVCQIVEIREDVKKIKKSFGYENKKDETISYDVAKKILKENPDVEYSLYILLNFFENLTRGIKQGIYDEEVVKVALKGTMIDAYNYFKNYIKKHRKSRENDLLYKEFECVVLEWENNIRQEQNSKRTDVVS